MTCFLLRKNMTRRCPCLPFRDGSDANRNDAKQVEGSRTSLDMSKGLETANNHHKNKETQQKTKQTHKQKQTTQKNHHFLKNFSVTWPSSAPLKHPWPTMVEGPSSPLYISLPKSSMIPRGEVPGSRELSWLFCCSDMF